MENRSVQASFLVDVYLSTMHGSDRELVEVAGKGQVLFLRVLRWLGQVVPELCNRDDRRYETGDHGRPGL